MRSEAAVFATLGLAGVAMVAVAAIQMMGFSAGGSNGASGLVGQSAPSEVTRPASDWPSVTNNVSPPADCPTVSRNLAEGKSRSGAKSRARLFLR